MQIQTSGIAATLTLEVATEEREGDHVRERLYIVEL
jgi:hypothetical protein